MNDELRDRLRSDITILTIGEHRTASLMGNVKFAWRKDDDGYKNSTLWHLIPEELFIFIPIVKKNLLLDRKRLGLCNKSFSKKIN